jgi:hypothetical protein
MLYVVYNQDTDIDEVRTENLLEAVQQATEIYDRTYDQRADKHNDKNYTVQIIDMEQDEYDTNSWDNIQDHVCSTSSLYQFITTYGVNDLTETKTKKNDLINKEVYHNLDEAEQLEVLKFVPDAMLLSELSRRMYEYRKYSDAISELGEELKIYV